MVRAQEWRVAKITLSRWKNGRPRRLTRPSCGNLERAEMSAAKEGGTAGGVIGADRPSASERPQVIGALTEEARSAVDLPDLERDILALWRTQRTFAKTLEQTAEAPRWTFYEGPPTANGAPGVHHVEARVFKDVFPRYKTMQGHLVERKAGWDCQGLHVEVGVEKELGLSGKRSIEDYGVEAFNARCRSSVERHVDAFEAMTERMGYWVDMSAAYRTMDSTYIDSVWWSLKRIFDAGLLVEDQRITPYCPRCETALSDHELAQGYETVADPSVYVRMPLTTGPLAGRAALLVWTTTPWTLVSNTAVAVHPDVNYVVASNGEERLVVAEPLLRTVLGEGWVVKQRLVGTEMERWEYERPFWLVDFPAAAHLVVLGSYVTTADGTGLVHQSPAFGADDLAVAKAYGLPVVNPVRADGHFSDDVRLVGGQFFKHADADLVTDLDSRGLLFRHQTYEHSYPHCWRCHTPLMYYAMPSWYIRTTQVKDQLLRENERTSWYPETIQWGRYGNWLHNNVDWALSRSRYWGTPLPIWRCPQGHLRCVGSRAELAALSGRMLDDPHRPFVDEVTFECPAAGCTEAARRVPELIDSWYDAGSMPFAQWGYPYVDGSREEFERAYPAQYICEAIDQTRGWFYSLMAIGTIVFDQSSYQNVVVLGHIMAEDGRKMSKHLGNILEPLPLMERHGADALRWFMACTGSPWASRRVGNTVLQEIVRKVLLTYWNTVTFHVLYAAAAGWAPSSQPVADPAERPVLDRWAVSRASRLVGDVTVAMEDFDTQRAGALLAAYIDDLSNWYVRRSRRRFWEGDAAAFATLYECLHALTLLLAPLVPFITERVWQDVFRPGSPAGADSVHLAAWPRGDASLVDDQLEAQVRLARRVVELGRAARAEARVRTRQPLRRALIGSGAWSSLSDDLRREVAAELSVGAVDSLAGAGDNLVEHLAKANFRALGKRFGKDTPGVAAAIAATDAGQLASDLADGVATVTVDGQPVRLLADEVIVSERPREGWSVINEHGETVALDLELTPELLRAGLAREAIRLLQEARKAAGFDVSDRIQLWWDTDDDELAKALLEHEALVADEVLATTIGRGEPGDNSLATYHDPALGLRYCLRRR
ncbi:MAG: isoleucine--tRNA ligase [Nocardioidaceae bacterium]